jgi:hypothetical protein
MRKRRRKGSGASAPAATVTVNGVAVQMTVAPPAKGEPEVGAASGNSVRLLQNGVHRKAMKFKQANLLRYAMHHNFMLCHLNSTLPLEPHPVRGTSAQGPALVCADAPTAAVNANWAAMKAVVSLPAPFKRQGHVISTAAPADPAPSKGPEARGTIHPTYTWRWASL